MINEAVLVNDVGGSIALLNSSPSKGVAVEWLERSESIYLIFWPSGAAATPHQVKKVSLKEIYFSTVAGKSSVVLPFFSFLI
jgi:hypothetical protein